MCVCPCVTESVRVYTCVCKRECICECVCRILRVREYQNSVGKKRERVFVEIVEDEHEFNEGEDFNDQRIDGQF